MPAIGGVVPAAGHARRLATGFLPRADPGPVGQAAAFGLTVTLLLLALQVWLQNVHLGTTNGLWTWFKAMPEEMFRTLEKRLGWHMPITAKPV